MLSVNGGLKAAGTAHPGRISAEEAENMKCPYVCLFSSEDGTPEAVEAYHAALDKNPHDNLIEKFGNMHHGWMGAKANLDDEANAKEFQRGYGMAADFFKKHL